MMKMSARMIFQNSIFQSGFLSLLLLTVLQIVSVILSRSGVFTLKVPIFYPAPVQDPGPCHPLDPAKYLRRYYFNISSSTCQMY